MYKNYFGIKQKPFSIAPNPQFLFMSEGHREALAHLRYGLENEGGFVLLTGEVGTGKTTVLRCLLENVPDGANVAFLLNPKVTAHELLATICDELVVDYPQDSSIKVLIDALNRYLLAAHGKGRHTVLIIDEAQNLCAEVLEQIRLLTNLETDQQKLLQVIMIGQPELLEKLSRPELRQLSQRISARHHLGPLTMAETSSYVKHRLKVAGMDPQIFTASSLKKLFDLSSGIPRLINMICDRALLGSYGKGVSKVDASLVAGAGKEVLGSRLPGESLTVVPAWKVASITLLVCAIILVVINWPVIPPEQGGAPLSAVRVELEADLELKQQPMVEAALPGVDGAVAQQEVELADSVITWPIGKAATESEARSYLNLMELWGVSGYSVDDPWPCQYVEDHGLRCLLKQGSMEEILRLNRPAVLTMKNDLNEQFFAVLQAVQDDRATFVVGERVIDIGLADIALRWSGDYVLLWRPPPGYQGAIHPGDHGKDVLLLESRLALIAGEGYKGEDVEKKFGPSLVDRIKKIQFANNLVPDGIVGKETLIIINTLSGVDVPVLR